MSSCDERAALAPDRGGRRLGTVRAELIGRLRTLRAVTHLVTGPRGRVTADLLHQAERDPAALPRALASLNALAASDRRHVWASYAALTKPV